jgi:chorismate mutase
MIGATEANVHGALPRCVRVLVTVEQPRDRAVEHVYLGGAAVLRPDLHRDETGE